MLGSCVTSDDKCCIIFRPWTVTNVFWIMSKNKKTRGWERESQMKLLKSLSAKNTELQSFLVLAGENFEPRNRKEELVPLWSEIGRLWKRKMGFQNFTFLKTSFKTSFRTPKNIKSSQQARRKRKSKFPVPSSPASLHWGWTSTMSSREQPMDNRRLCLCVPKHFERSRRCRWLFNRSNGCEPCSREVSLACKLASCRVDAEWWCCLLPLIWLRLWRDIIYGGPRGPVNVYDPLRGHSCDSADEAATELECFCV